MARDVVVRSPGGLLQVGTLGLGSRGLSALDLLVGDAEAQEAPAATAEAPDARLDIRADTLSLDGDARTAVFAGSVRLTRRSVSLTCDRLTATYGAGGEVVSARAEGTVRLRRGAVSASAASAVLDLARAEVVLAGPALLQRAGDTIEGDRIVIAIDRERVTISGARGRLRLASGRAAR
jgi:lipopolysaccharide export system protein LptA